MLLVSLISGCCSQDLGDFGGEDGEVGLGGLLAALAGSLGDSDCTYRCSSGKAARPRPHHKPRYNGCGTKDFRVDVSNYPGFVECCNNHDMCYDTCGESRQECDTTFKQCMLQVCKSDGDSGKLRRKEVRECRSQADMMYGGVVALGCDIYLDSQKEACICIRPEEKHGF